MKEIRKDKNWLIEQYWGFDLSLKEIGALADCTDQSIFYWMKKYDIPTKPQYSHLKNLNQNFNHQSKAGKARAKITNKLFSHLARERLLKNNPGYLMHEKWKERNPIGYHNHQLKAGIEAGKIRGEQLTDWDFYKQHGYFKSQFPYPKEFNKTLKMRIFNRDGGLCQLCYELIYNGYGIHHIDYDKNNNAPTNLILLCPSCHSKTGFNREHWIAYFKNIISS